MTWDGLLVPSGSLSLLWFPPFLRLDSVFCFDSVATPQLSDKFLSLLRVHFYCLQRALICHPIKKKNHKFSLQLFCFALTFMMYLGILFLYIYLVLLYVGKIFFSPDTNSQLSYSLVLLSLQESPCWAIFETGHINGLIWDFYIWECHLFDITHKWQHPLKHPLKFLWILFYCFVGFGVVQRSETRLILFFHWKYHFPCLYTWKFSHSFIISSPLLFLPSEFLRGFSGLLQLLLTEDQIYCRGQSFLGENRIGSSQVKVGDTYSRLWTY